MQIVNPLPMQWEGKMKETFPEATWTEKPTRGDDTYLFCWCNEDTVHFINTEPKFAKYIVYVRRYEMFGFVNQVDWSKVDKVIMVNNCLANELHRAFGVEPEVLYNAIDDSKWSYRKRTHGKKIAMVGYINQKKNLPLAMQIMSLLPHDYELHLAGGIQDGATWMYLKNLADDMRVKVRCYGQIPHEDMDEWLEDKNYILSCAISEGCPNNVLEAMAKGIKPVIHNWPGAVEQFGDLVFNTVSEAALMIGSLSYDSEEYARMVEYKFGQKNYERLKEIVCKL
jgi:glycosyltransferase involved in cell wall biosynthesis